MYIQTLGIILSALQRDFFPKAEIDIQLYLLYIMHKSALFVWSIISSCHLEPSCLQDVTVTGSMYHTLQKNYLPLQ